MYYIYRRSTQNLITKIPLGCEILLTFYSPQTYEVVIT